MSSNSSNRRRCFRAIATAVLAVTIATAAVAPANAADYPSWGDVQAARSSEQATNAQVARIESVLASLTSVLDTAQKLSEFRGLAFRTAQDRLDAATGKSEQLEGEVKKARADASAARLRAGQLAARLYRGGTRSAALDIFFSGTQADSLLRRLSMAAQLTRNDERIFDSASLAEKSASALAAQARVARSELKRLAGLAQTALDEAVSAQTAADAALREQQSNAAVLAAQLATLRDSRISVEQGYALGEQKRREAAAAASAATGGAGTSAAISPAGWTNPILDVRGYQSYGVRLHPVYNEWLLHAGDDYGAQCGTPIYAASAGKVTFAGPSGGYGNLITISHSGGVSTSYAHMYSTGLRVKPGTSVVAGQQIAVVGSAGVSTGCHLHFEIRRGGIATSPAPFLRSQGVR